jgi:hypothetical protein
MNEEDKDVLLAALREVVGTYADNNRYDALLYVIALMRRIHDEP